MANIITKSDAQAVARAVVHALEGADPDVVKRVMDALSAAMGTAERRRELQEETEEDADALKSLWSFDLNADWRRERRLKAIDFDGPAPTKKSRGMRNSDLQPPTSEADRIDFGDDPPEAMFTPEERAALDKTRARRRVWSRDEALAMQDPRFAPGGEFDFDGEAA